MFEIFTDQHISFLKNADAFANEVHLEELQNLEEKDAGLKVENVAVEGVR